jgi:hypothetical protein
MTFETVIVLFLTALSVGFLCRDLLRGSSAKGCASGCGSCPADHCALRRLEVQLKAASKRNP